jgi:hypothetical protein
LDVSIYWKRFLNFCISNKNNEFLPSFTYYFSPGAYEELIMLFRTKDKSQKSEILSCLPFNSPCVHRVKESFLWELLIICLAENSITLSDVLYIFESAVGTGVKNLIVIRLFYIFVQVNCILRLI